MTKSTALSYRPDIDGLRAIAVLSVLLYHAFPTIIRSGYVGVDIFFVISGFLITTIIRKEVMRDDFSILSFYQKRIRRIYPALILTLSGILFLSWFLLSTEEYAVTLKHVIFSSLFTENFLLWSEDGYFDKASIFKPTLHIWSLSIEEQFYIFWPFIIAFLVRRKLEIKGILLFIFLSFLINLYDIYNHPAAAYYSPLGRSWELMIGSLFSVIYTDMKPKWSVKRGSFLATAGFVMVVLSIFFIPTQKYFPGFSAIPVVVGSALIILYGENTIISKILTLKKVVFIGLISYPLYLVHWPLMSFSSIILGRESSKANAACLVLSFILATLIYKLVERPIAKKKLTVSYALFCVMLIIPISSFVLIGSQSRVNEVKLANETEWSFLKGQYKKFGLTEFNNNGTGIYTLSKNVSGDSYIFLGDSHIANIAEYVDHQINSSQNPPSVLIAAGGGCIPMPNVYTDDKRRQSCWPMRSSAINMIKDKNINNIVIGGAWFMYFFNKKDYYYVNNGGKYSINTQQGRDMAISDMMQMIEDLVSSGKNVYFIKDAPYILDVSPGIYRARLKPFVSYDAHEDLNVDIEKSQQEFIYSLAERAKKSGAKVIDIFDKVCLNGKCKLIDDGQYIYADSGHFNPSWLRKNYSILSDIHI